MVHTVVVVTGTVVGVVVVVAVEPEELPDCDVLVVGGVVDVVGVSSDDEDSSDDVEVLPVVEGTVTGVVATGFAVPAKYITVSPESTAEPTRRA